MAIITTTLVPGPQRFPFIGQSPDMEQWTTEIPKAEILFAEVGTSITLAGVGDSQRLAIVCDLPVSYAYVYLGGTVMLRETVAGDLANWDDEAEFFIDNSPSSVGAQGRWRWHQRMRKDPVGAISGGSVTLVESVFQGDLELPKVIIPLPNDQVRLVFQVDNVSTNDAAMTTDFFFRFLQFDLNQAFFWAVNMPTLVR